MTLNILREKLVLFVKKIDWKGLFINVVITVLSGLLAGYLDNVDAIHTALSQYMDPLVVGPLLNIIAKIIQYGINALKLAK